MNMMDIWVDGKNGQTDRCFNKHIVSSGGGRLLRFEAFAPKELQYCQIRKYPPGQTGTETDRLTDS
jgi:hypothetical protein